MAGGISWRAACKERALASLNTRTIKMAKETIATR